MTTISRVAKTRQERRNLARNGTAGPYRAVISQQKARSSHL